MAPIREPLMTVWYKTDPTRFNYRELWRLSGRGLAPFARAVLRKWFKIRPPVKFGYGFGAALNLVDLQSLPDRPREALGAMVSQAERHGFRFVLCHASSSLGDISGFAAALLSADGTTLAQATWVKAGLQEEAAFTLGSRCEGRLLTTGNQPDRIDSPPEFESWHMPGKAIDELVAIHSGRLDRLGRERVPRATEADVAERIVESRQRIHVYQLSRGVHVPMTQDEVERLSGVVTASPFPENGNPYQAPREDQPEPIAMPPAAPKSGWRTSMISGFLGGVFFGVALGFVSLRDGLPQGLITWELVIGFFILFPVLLGAIGASLGLAIWLMGCVVRRFVS